MAAGCPRIPVAGSWKLLVTVPIRYMRPGHHPNDEASTQMAIDYLNYSPVAKAARERAQSAGSRTRSVRRCRVPTRLTRERQSSDEGFSGSGHMRRQWGVHEHLPRVFDVQEDGLHLLQEQPDSDLRQQLIGAAVSCPTQAITVED